MDQEEIPCTTCLELAFVQLITDELSGQNNYEDGTHLSALLSHYSVFHYPQGFDLQSPMVPGEVN